MGLRDVVIAGPDMSGTSTQVAGIIDYLTSKGMTYRDMRKTEFHAAFHAEAYKDINKNFASLDEWLKVASPLSITGFFMEVLDHSSNSRTADMVQENNPLYINPDSADLWVFEEPTYRGAGQVVRNTINNTLKFGFQTSGLEETLGHQLYRSDEFKRFRKVLREKEKFILRSRSEESAAYQIFDEEGMPSGPQLNEYLNNPGHAVAFANAPSDIIIVHGGENLSVEEYMALTDQRSAGRDLDDLEQDYARQLMVNKRYASTWMEQLYDIGTNMHGGQMPNLHRIEMFDEERQAKGKEEIQAEVNAYVKEIIER